MKGLKNTGYIKLCLIASVLLTSQADAANAKNIYSVIGRGLESCGKFTAAANEGTYQNRWSDWNKYLSYTQGYLTGVNLYLPDNKDILGNTDMEGAMAYLEKYCRDNPLSKYTDALDSLTTDLYPTRSK